MARHQDCWVQHLVTAVDVIPAVAYSVVRRREACVERSWGFAGVHCSDGPCVLEPYGDFAEPEMGVTPSDSDLGGVTV